MKNAAEDKNARSSMSSTFGSVMNPDLKDFKLTLDQVIKQRKKVTTFDEHEELEVVSILD